MQLKEDVIEAVAGERQGKTRIRAVSRRQRRPRGGDGVEERHKRLYTSYFDRLTSQYGGMV